MIRRNLGASAFWLALLAVPAYSALQGSVVRLVSPTWRVTGSEQLNIQDIRQWGGDVKVEREYGVRSVTLKSYSEADQTAGIVEEQAADASSAYGLFTFYRTDAMHAVPGVELAAEGPNGAIMARGKLFIRVPASAASSLSAGDLRSLLIAIGGAKPSAESLLELPSSLPLSGLRADSVKYILGAEACRIALPQLSAKNVGFAEDAAEVESGVYRIGNASVTAVAINYPTPQIAHRRFSLLAGILQLNRQNGPQSSYGKRAGSYVVLALDAPNADVARRALAKFKFSENVSWDQPRPLTGRELAFQLLHLFLSNIFIILLSAGSAILGGLIIFFGRLALGRIFPNALWAHTDRDPTIRLNLF